MMDKARSHHQLCFKFETYHINIKFKNIGCSRAMDSEAIHPAQGLSIPQSLPGQRLCHPNP